MIIEFPPLSLMKVITLFIAIIINGDSANAFIPSTNNAGDTNAITSNDNSASRPYQEWR